MAEDEMVHIPVKDAGKSRGRFRLIHPGGDAAHHPGSMTTSPHPGVVIHRFKEATAGMPLVPKKVTSDGGESMKRRFSDQQLHELRNLIPIDWLIEKQSLIPSKLSEGFFRFLCPLCGEFRTATHAKTNLARCFRCEKNFNTIDMVMLCRNLSFVESVEFLKACRNKLATGGNDGRSTNPPQPRATYRRSGR